MVLSLFRWLHSGRKVGLWYHSEYSPKSLRSAAHLIGIDPDRMKTLLERLINQGIVRQSNLHLSPLAGFEDLKLAHTAGYLEAVTKTNMVGAAFGYDMAPHETDQILRWQRRAVGGTIAAAHAVLEQSCDYGVNLGGGFHHATAEKASGFCIFNDIAVAIAKLRKRSYFAPIAIVDLDFHQGNGNLSIFSEDPSVVTYSIHGTVWDETVGVSDYGYLMPPGTGDSAYLEKLKRTLPAALRKHSPELVFYIAGNDVLGGDRLGNFSLTPQGVLERDRFVTEQVRKIGGKLVVTLGGGYSPAAWNCSANYIEFLATGRATAGVRWESALRSKFRKISEKLQEQEDREDFQEETQRITEGDVIGDLGTVVRARQLLDYYSTHGVEYAFEKFGILEKIRNHGFLDFKFEVDTTDVDRQAVRVFGRSRFDPGKERKLFLELVVHMLTLYPAEQYPFDSPLQFVSVKWLLIQDPEAGFSSDRPRLPGQEHPGLGVAEDIQEFLVQFCGRSGLDGLFSTPSHYHNAAMAARSFRFLDPFAEGRFLALRQTLLRFHLNEASSLLEEGGVVTRDGKPFKWEPADQVLPVSERLLDYFLSEGYRTAVQEKCQEILAMGIKVDPEKAGKYKNRQFL